MLDDLKERESIFNNLDAWIRKSSNPLTFIFRNAVKSLGIDEPTFCRMLESFIENPKHHISRQPDIKSTFRGNVYKSLSNSSLTWKKFIFLMKMIGFTEMDFSIHSVLRNGHEFENTVYIPLKDVDVMKNRVLDPSNLPKQNINISELKLNKFDVLESDDKKINLVQDEMQFFIRLSLLKANIDIMTWSELMLNYVKDLDKASRSRERNNFSSGVLLHNTGTWKKFTKFQRFILTEKSTITISATKPCGEKWQMKVSYKP